MAKKAVASLQSKSKRLTKAIKMVKSSKSGAYTFVETILPPEKVNEFLSKQASYFHHPNFIYLLFQLHLLYLYDINSNQFIMGLFKKLFSIFKRKKEKKQESVEDEKNNLSDSSTVLDSSTDVKAEKKENHQIFLIFQ